MKKIKVKSCPKSKKYAAKIVVEDSKGHVVATYGYFRTRAQAEKTLKNLVKGRKFLRGF